ncbi:hypothetical protein [Amycolatopsis sp. GM8]|uniref:hypothetical protein n=1 Tax=Amycolatopsis sp. GM8 TaxID=2896530 RepID=UPI001F17C4D2|nr:hypothetical protein [Amycolatopsis sp. GM8]
MLRVGGWNAAGSGENYAIESLLRHAAALGLRAPELTVVFGERAASLAESAGSDKLWVRAEGLVVSGRVRLGLRAETVGRAVAALRAAEDLGETVLAARLRTDLAVCARSAGVPLTGLAALRPTLGVAGFSGAAKAAALCHLVGCLSQFGRKPELDRMLAEADRLCGADDDLDGDDRLLGRALVRVAMSAHRRRHADVMGAADAARTGLGLLDQLDDPGTDGGVVRVRLILQLVCSLLDRGDSENAAEIAESVLIESPRAAAVAPLGWLRMAVATRVLLPAGSVNAAAVVLRDAVYSTERHGLHALTSRLWAELAHVEERLGRSSEAIECLHQSRAAEHLYARSRRQAMGLLAGAFGNGGQASLDLDEVLAAIAPSAAQAPAAIAETNGGHSAGRNGKTAAHRPAVQDARAADQGGHVRSEPAAAERTVVLPRIVEAAGERRPASVNGKRRAEETSAPAAKRAVEVAKPVVKLAPVPVDRSVVPDLPLAPPPADEPAPRVSLASERKPAAKSDAPDNEEARATTRHDSTHGSVAARSVLDRLGISAGSGGGRRRAADDSGESRPAAEAADSGREGGTAGFAASAEPAETPRNGAGSAHSAEPARGAESAQAPRNGGSGGAGHRAEPMRSAYSAQSAEAPRNGGSAGSGHSAESVQSATPARGADFSWGQELAEALGVSEPAAPTSSEKRTDAAQHGQSGGSARNHAAGESHRDSEAPDTARAAETAARAAASDVARTLETAAHHRAPDSARADEAISNAAPAAETTAHHRAPNDAHAAGVTTRDTASAESAHVIGATVGDTAAESAHAVGATAHDTTSAESTSTQAAAHDTAPSGDAKAEADGNPFVINDPWLPRLKLPPSLEPFEDFSEGVPTSASHETHFTSTPVIEDGGLGEPFRSEYTSPLDDDLPADAGLADLLARALAEHQAGTSSAAALVKRLGNQSADDRRTVNGHGRNGEPPANGHHNGDH